MLKRIFQGQRGFTLVEMMAVIGIMGVLAALVAASLTGIGSKGQEARLVSDQETLDKSTNQFFTESLPQKYPVISATGTEADQVVPLLVTGIEDVAIIDFDAKLPQDPTRVFVPDFLKDVPESAGLVSWRINTRTGKAFFARQGAKLVRLSDARLNVAASSKVKDSTANYTFTLTMNKFEAAINTLTVEVPSGYVFNANPASAAGVRIGTVAIGFKSDNPWITGSTVPATGTLETTGRDNEWVLKVDYPDSVSVLGTPGSTVSASNVRIDRNHKVTVVEPTSNSSQSPGKLTIEMNRAPDVALGDHNLATEVWVLTINGVAANNVTVIKNPSLPGVYRWLAKQFTTVEFEGVFRKVSGNQSVVIQ